MPSWRSLSVAAAMFLLCLATTLGGSDGSRSHEHTVAITPGSLKHTSVDVSGSHEHTSLDGSGSHEHKVASGSHEHTGVLGSQESLDDDGSLDSDEFLSADGGTLEDLFRPQYLSGGSSEGDGGLSSMEDHFRPMMPVYPHPYLSPWHPPQVLHPPVGSTLGMYPGLVPMFPPTSPLPFAPSAFVRPPVGAFVPTPPMTLNPLLVPPYGSAFVVPPAALLGPFPAPPAHLDSHVAAQPLGLSPPLDSHLPHPSPAVPVDLSHAAVHVHGLEHDVVDHGLAQPPVLVEHDLAHDAAHDLHHHHVHAHGSSLPAYGALYPGHFHGHYHGHYDQVYPHGAGMYPGHLHGHYDQVYPYSAGMYPSYAHGHYGQMYPNGAGMYPGHPYGHYGQMYPYGAGMYPGHPYGHYGQMYPYGAGMYPGDAHGYYDHAYAYDPRLYGYAHYPQALAYAQGPYGTAYDPHALSHAHHLSQHPHVDAYGPHGPYDTAYGAHVHHHAYDHMMPADPYGLHGLHDDEFHHDHVHWPADVAHMWPLHPDQYDYYQNLYWSQEGYCSWEKPVPCWGRGTCISLSAVCDKHVDCGNYLDEDSRLCISGKRPQVELITMFLSLPDQKWMLTKLFNNRDPYYVALALKFAANIPDLTWALGLDADAGNDTRVMFQAAAEDNSDAAEDMGMKDENWAMTKYFFKRLQETGFDVS